jgi:hypothetical protein
MELRIAILRVAGVRASKKARSQLVASDFSGSLVHRAVERVAVDGGGAGVDPEGRRA